MKPKRAVIGVGAVLATVVVTGFAIAAGGGDEQPLTGSSLDRATAAALEHVGGGVVVETETGDDGAAYEVEIRRPSGRTVEVSLDERFTVVGAERDDDGTPDAEREGDKD